MSRRTINKIAWGLHAECMEDIGTDEQYMRRAEKIYGMVENAVMRRLKKLLPAEIWRVVRQELKDAE